MPSDTPAKAGLEDIVVASSSICYLDGTRGVLAYRGYDIHDLAERSTFEEVCHLLWHGRLPSRAELGELQSQLAEARPLPEGAAAADAVDAADQQHGLAADARIGGRTLRSGRQRFFA